MHWLAVLTSQCRRGHAWLLPPTPPLAAPLAAATTRRCLPRCTVNLPCTVLCYCATGTPWRQLGTCALPAVLAMRLQCGACLRQHQLQLWSRMRRASCLCTLEHTSAMKQWCACCWRRHQRRLWSRMRRAVCPCTMQQSTAMKQWCGCCRKQRRRLPQQSMPWAEHRCSSPMMKATCYSLRAAERWTRSRSAGHPGRCLRSCPDAPPRLLAGPWSPAWCCR